MTFCKCGYFATSIITQTIQCPICKQPILVLSQEDQGRYAWSLLHTEPSPTPEWYELWKKQIPKHGCLCLNEWSRITAKLPPDFSSVEAFREWAIEAHNQVNRSLGKPIWYGSVYDAANTSFAISPVVTG